MEEGKECKEESRRGMCAKKEERAEGKERRVVEVYGERRKESKE